jgi:hypothetical protein
MQDEGLLFCCGQLEGVVEALLHLNEGEAILGK